MKLALLMALWSVGCALTRGDSKTDADLRQRLAESEKRVATLTATVSRLTSKVSTNTDRAANSADRAQQTAADNAELARKAAVDAAVAVEAAKDRQDQLLRSADRNTTLLVTTLSGFLTLLVSFIFKWWSESRDRRWSMEHRLALMKEVKETRVETREALAVANNLNEKIAAVGLQVAKEKPPGF